MKTDIEIAQEAKMLHIREVAEKLGIAEDELELYGKYKAKLSDELIERVKDEPDGKLILVTAINPTPAGEGKTTISVGLPLDRVLELKAALQEAVMHRLFRWRI